MLRPIARFAALVAGTVMAVAGSAGSASAEDIVPSGCVGSVYYACTGTGQPPHPTDAGWWKTSAVVEVPVHLQNGGVPLLPGQTVGGQTVGGVVIPVGGELAPERTVTLGGPIGPFDTGIPVPVSVCAFVACVVGGEPIVVPGIDLPLVPVVIPAITVPAETVDIPVIATIPEESTPPVGVPSIDAQVTSIRVMTGTYDFYVLGDTLCRAGGGQTVMTRWDAGNYVYFDCQGGATEHVADRVFEFGGIWYAA